MTGANELRASSGIMPAGEDLPSEESTARRAEPGSYLPALDGLRFLAFLLVFFHHSAPLPFAYIFPQLRQRGWVGVEVFFAISAFLFFRLLMDEEKIAGRINIANFYIRRLLRLYPLMVAFPLLMLVIWGAGRPHAFARLLGLASFNDNFMVWLLGYNTSIPFSAHLWTLSYEFQIYLLIPPAFLLYRAIGFRNFMIVLVCVFAVCFAARGAFILAGAKHPIIWVTPFLRPESTLIGIALSLGLSSRLKTPLVVAVLFVGVAVFLIGPNVQRIGGWTLVLYPIIAIVGGSLLWLVAERGVFSSFFGSRPIAFLGKISFGLYVYHLVAIAVVERSAASMPVWGRFWLALLFTIALGTASYYGFEQWFLRLKRRFSVIESRPI
ncbi:MAG: acyltransferase [Bauldia sp.]|nr:acyltransferase [Bauldia sp.]